MSLYIPHPQTRNELIDNYLDATKSAMRPERRRGRSLNRVSEEYTSITHSDLLDLLKHQRQLAWSVSNLVAGKDISDVLKKQSEDAARQSVGVLEATLLAALGWDPLSTAPTATSARKAEEVFGVPELAEMILEKLEAHEVLEVALVGKQFHACIFSSTKIRKQLGLLPDQKTNWYSVFKPNRRNSYGKRSQPLSHLDCHVLESETYDPKEALDTVTVEAEWNYDLYPNRRHRPGNPARYSATAAGSRLPLSLGPVVRSMLICQPPITTMEVLPECCSGPDPSYYESRPPGGVGIPAPRSIPLIERGTGITVGDLFDATNWMIKEHLHCHYAGYEDHDPDTGLVCVEVTFRGMLKLREGDPARPRYFPPREYVDNWDDYDEPSFKPRRRRDRRDPLHEYIRAKRNALLTGKPAPLFEEFKAAEMEGSDDEGTDKVQEGLGDAESDDEEYGGW